MALKIEDYAVIGDCKTAALIGRNGSIDWLCWPRFDSAACFAALLGECENGRWLIAPKEEPIEVSRRYCSGSLVLETEFRTQTGSATLGFPLMRSARFDGLIDSWAVRYYCLKTLHGLKRLASPGEAPRQRVDLIVMAAGVCRRTAVVSSLFSNSSISDQGNLL